MLKITNKFTAALLATLLALGDSLAYSQTVNTIRNGKLSNDLDANGQKITNASKFSTGTGTPTASIHLSPNDAPTTAAYGIKIGSDAATVAIYRSGIGTTGGTGQITIVGDVVITGSLAVANSPVTPNGANTWTGTNTWNGTSVFGGPVSVGNGGITFTGTGAADTLSHLGVTIGSNVQAYSALLTGIAAQPATNNYLLVGNGSGWVSTAPASVATVLGLGTGSSPTHSALTLTNGATIGTTLAIAGATTATGGVTVTGTTTGNGITLGVQPWHIYAPSGIASTSIGTDAGFGVAGKLIVGDNSGSTAASALIHILPAGTPTLAANGIKIGTDISIYRSGTATLSIPGTLVTGALTLSTTPLATSSGGTGLTSITGASQTFLQNYSGIGYITGLLNTNTVNANVLQDATITSTQMGANSVATASIQSGAVTSAKLAAPSGSTTSTVGDSTHFPVLTFNAQGQVLTATATSFPAASIADNSLTPAKLQDYGVGVGSFGTASKIPRITVNAKGQVSNIAEVDVVLAVANLNISAITAGNYVSSLSLTASNGLRFYSGTSGTGYAATPQLEFDPNYSPTFNSVTAGLTVPAAKAFTMAATSSISISSPSAVTFDASAKTAIRNALSLTSLATLTDTNSVLTNIAPLTPSVDSFIEYTGSAWRLATVSQTLTSLGLGSSSSPTFTSLTLGGTLSVTGISTFTGAAGFTAATASTSVSTPTVILQNGGTAGAGKLTYSSGTTTTRIGTTATVTDAGVITGSGYALSASGTWTIPSSSSIVLQSGSTLTVAPGANVVGLSAFGANFGTKALTTATLGSVIPDVQGQLGLNTETFALYQATGTAAGNWARVADQPPTILVPTAGFISYGNTASTFDFGSSDGINVFAQISDAGLGTFKGGLALGTSGVAATVSAAGLGTFVGGLKVGSASGASGTITKIYTTTATPTWTASQAAGAESTYTVTVSGVTTAKNGSVSLGFSASLGAKMIVSQAWVSAADTVTFKVYNADSVVHTATGTVRVTVTEF